MTDDIRKLKEALGKEGHIAPEKSAKKRAIAQAMEAYDQENSERTQGTGIGARLMGTANTVIETLFRRPPMRLSPALAGTASLGVIVVATLSATYIQTRNWDDPFKSPAPAEQPQTNEKFEDKSSLSKAKKERVIAQVRREQDSADARKAAPSPAPPAAEVSQPLARLAPGSPPVGGHHRMAPMKRDLRSAQNRIAQGGYAQTREKRAILPDRPVPPGYQDQGRDKFEAVAQNPIKVVQENPVSTFSIDVDTASYSFVRSSLNNNVLPPKDAVRVEELINYFPYDYAKPRDKSVPFKASVTVLPSPWNAERKLMHIGIAGYELEQAQKPKSNLVFLLDTSGSMNAANKLPLVINSMKMLLETLGPDDTVAIVTYAGKVGTALEPTQVKDKSKIIAALDRLSSRGSTAGGEGIRQAYDLARHSFKKDGVNRVILATDGDFNVGITDRNELKSFVERQRKTGIYLSVLGFGRGNYNDALMQTLAQNGNGNAAYIDTLNEARKVLVDEATSTLFPIAKDVKLQMEFNPLKVAEYRLIGYETRMLKRQDFNNDKVDAGDIGAGHQVTAIYEITPADSTAKALDPLRYGTTANRPAPDPSDEYGFLKIRYKLPEESTSKLISTPVTTNNEVSTVSAASPEIRFAAAVAGFGQLLKGGTHTGAFSFDDVIKLAQGAKGDDPFGYRAEFVNLARLAKTAPAMQSLQRR